MEGLFILIGIFVINAVIKSMTAKKKSSSERSHLPPTRRMSSSEDDEMDEVEQSPDAEQHHAPRNLQELIRQFQEAQRQASQGTYVPPNPPVEEDVPEDEVDLPVVKPSNPGHFSFKEIAESVVQWEEVSTEYLQQAFGFSEKTAAQVLAELQKHKIVGRDMGDGFCDVLVRDKVELANLFKREQAEAKKGMEDELERQRKLETRAREARENTGISNNGIAGDGISSNADENTEKKSRIRLSRNIRDIRRGFIWAKVIDEPRFKRRWDFKNR